jgi:hypothetical protein
MRLAVIVLELWMAVNPHHRLPVIMEFTSIKLIVVQMDAIIEEHVMPTQITLHLHAIAIFFGMDPHVMI